MVVRPRLAYIASLVFWFSSGASSAEPDWVASWYGSPTLACACGELSRFENSTFHTVVYLSAGGDRLRVQFSNLYGRTMLKVGAIRVTANGESKRVTFNGALQLSLPPGATSLSDAVDISTTVGTTVRVSAYYPEQIPERVTVSNGSAESNMLTPDNGTIDRGRAITETSLRQTYFLTRVDVQGQDSLGTIVALGDSITSGGPTHWPVNLEMGVAERWPALLGRRLAKAGRTFGIINAGINGNRLLRDGESGNNLNDEQRLSQGQSALKRFERDVLEQPNVTHVIVYEGINDIGASDNSFSYNPHTVNVDDIVAALRSMAERAHQRGIKFYAATLTPFDGIQTSVRQYYSVEKDRVRNEVNSWIRGTDVIDGYVDFDRAISDPERPSRIKPEFDSGDHIHPNNAGQRAISEGIDLSMFQGNLTNVRSQR